VAPTRRLAAIMFTDMVGFTASAQIDEAASLKLLHEQEGLVRRVLSAHFGREIKSTGDGFLVEFKSALHATECAIDIQRQLHLRNSRAELTPIELRIGVHLGDVEDYENDIFGDAVNIASRIGPSAAPGGVCISGPVFDQIHNKIPDRLEKLEPKSLKNVKFPIDLYRVVLPWSGPEPPVTVPIPTGLAILPFTNISPDPKDEYFADGLTEEVITVLSQLRGLRVIARTSVMQYKSTLKAVAQIASELGVSSVLEGSVRKAGDRLRITMQLIDAPSQGHLWAKTYDRELDDVFAVQTDIAKEVAEALKVELRSSEATRLSARSPVRPESYLAYLKGRTLLHDYSQESLEAAKAQFELAITLDSKNASAHSGLADAARVIGWLYSGVPRSEVDETGRRLAARAIELDPNLAEAHASLALVLWDNHEFEAAEREFRWALSLNPSYSPAHHWYAGLLEDEGRADEAVTELSLAEGADPLGPQNVFAFAELLAWLGRVDEAFAKIQRLRELEPSGLFLHVALTRYHLARSELEAYLKEQQIVEELIPEPRWKPICRAWYYAVSGEKAHSMAVLRQEDSLPEFPQTAWAIAWAYAELGELDECFRWLEKAFDSRLLPLYPFRLDRRREDVRRDPRFQALMARMNLA
jgi:adenylate cyclase